MIDLAIADGRGRDHPQRPRQAQRALARGAAVSWMPRTAAAEASGVRALVLRGEGRAFCAGRDISGVDPATDDVPGYLDAVEAAACAASRPSRRRRSPPCRAPASASGSASRSRPTSSTSPRTRSSARRSSNLGAMLDSGGHALLYERLGAHRALDLIYTGELMTGAEAVAPGCSAGRCPRDELLEFTRERAAGRQPGRPRRSSPRSG